MPDREKLNFMLGNTPGDLSKVRLQGLEKPFEELTVSELVQLRPGADVADTYEINAVTDNVSVTNSSMLSELGRIQGVRAMQQVADQARLNDIRAQVAPTLGAPASGGISPSSAEPGPTEVLLPRGDGDVFHAGSHDPFQA